MSLSLPQSLPSSGLWSSADPRFTSPPAHAPQGPAEQDSCPRSDVGSDESDQLGLLLHNLPSPSLDQIKCV